MSKYPFWKDLTKETEIDLSKKAQKGDKEAAKKLAHSHISFVEWVAAKYSGYGFEKQELIQEGSIGLMKAIEKFDPSQGVTLTSFSYAWIKSSILEFVMANYKPVKITSSKSNKKLFFNIRKYRNGNQITVTVAKKISEELGVEIENVFEMVARLFSSDLYFDQRNAHDEDDDYHDLLPSIEFDYGYSEESFDTALLQHLPERTASIITKRYLTENKVSLQEIGREFGISFERVRQIEKQGLQQLREIIGEPL